MVIPVIFIAAGIIGVGSSLLLTISEKVKLQIGYKLLLGSAALVLTGIVIAFLISSI